MNRVRFWLAVAAVVVVAGALAGTYFWDIAVSRSRPLAVVPPRAAKQIAAAQPAIRHHQQRPGTLTVPRDSDDAPGGDKFLYKIRAFPYQRIPRGARARAFAQAQMLRAAADSAQQWTLIGPQPIADGYAGRVTTLAIDPHDNNTVYLGSAEGGVWKSTDAGAHWQPLTDFEPALAIGSLAIDPSNSKVIYAGTGEANFNFDGYDGMGVLKSTDAGNTWSLLGSTTFDQSDIGALAISPTNTAVILASTSSGVYRSADGGETWQNVVFGRSTGVVFDPSNGSLAYAAAVFGPDGAGIYKSADGGQTWKISNGSGTKSIPFSQQTFRITLAISPSQPGTLYVGYDTATGTPSPLAGFFKSTDGAATWRQLPGQAYCSNQCWYNNVVAVSPTDPNLLLGGGVSLVQSTDDGNTWLPAAGPGFHVDQHAIAFTADGSHVFAGNDGGVWSSATANAAFHWTNLNATLALTQFYHGLSIAPGNPGVSFGGTQDNGSLQYAASQWVNVGCGDGSATAIDPLNPQIVYISCAGLSSSAGAVLRSLTGGGQGSYLQVSNGLNESIPFLPYLTIDPSNPQNLYFTGNQHIYQTTNGGTLWKAISPNVTAGVMPACAIAVAPSDSNTVYSGSCDGMAMVTHNALSGTSSTWTNISAGLPGTSITHITVDPGSPLKAYATLSGFMNAHVVLTEDGGQSWTDITGNLPDISANDLVIDPDLAGALYVSNDMGVFWTNTTGKYWSALGTGLPHAAVLSLAFEHTSRTLRAATHGRSVWDLVVPIEGLNLIPIIQSVTPAQIPLNSANPSLTVTGTNFISTSMALLNGQPRPATLGANGELMVTPAAADVATDALLAVTVVTPAPGGGTSAPYYIKAGPNPAIYPGAVLNAASGFGAAPGAIVSVYGVDLAAGVTVAGHLPLPTNLAGASLAVADAGANYAGSAPLIYVSGGQMNVQIPWEVQIFDKVAFTPMLNGAKGAPLNVTMQLAAPGIFTLDQTGKGQGAITDALTGRLAAPVGKFANFPTAQPVKRGGYLSIYCTGLGPVDHTQADGAPAPSNPLANTQYQPIVMIGGVQGTVLFSGLAPGYVGLNQVNVQVPMNAPTGSAVPLSMSDGFGDVSNTVTIALE